MKPTVPEIGTILRLDGENAVVLLIGGKSCKGCGAGKLGLCKAGGDSMMLTAKNTISARIGDTIMVGIDQEVQIKGYFLAYIFPLLAFIVGSIVGNILGNYLSIPSLDALLGFAALSATAVFTFLRLRRLDLTHKMTVKKVLSDEVFSAEVKSDEERRHEGYAVNH
jgi:positive regulator of sigma E activity